MQDRPIEPSKFSVEDDSISNLLITLVVSIVDYEADVKVVVDEKDGMPTLTLSVARADMGKIICSNGRMARSLRMFIAAASAKLKRRYYLAIDEKPGGG